MRKISLLHSIKKAPSYSEWSFNGKGWLYLDRMEENKIKDTLREIRVFFESLPIKFDDKDKEILSYLFERTSIMEKIISLFLLDRDTWKHIISDHAGQLRKINPNNPEDHRMYRYIDQSKWFIDHLQIARRYGGAFKFRELSSRKFEDCSMFALNLS